MKEVILPKINRLEYYEADAIARASGKPVSTVQAEHHVNQLSEKIPTAESQRIQNQREKLEKEQAELAEAERKYAQKLSNWEVLLTKRDNIRAELGFGAGQYEQCDQEQGRVEFIKNQFGNQYATHAYPNQLFELGQVIAGARVIREVYPKWKAEREAELAKVVAEIETFAKANGIPLK